MAHSRFSQTCCTSPAAMWLWAAAFAVLYAMGPLMRSTWPVLEPHAPLRAHGTSIPTCGRRGILDGGASLERQ
jgi:hypothetical protein